MNRESKDESGGRQRTLAVKIEIDWKNAQSRHLYQTLRDLGWQSARYRNLFIQRLYAEKMGWRRDPAAGDAHDLTKQGRAGEKGNLSGAAYSAAEREAAAAFARDAKRIYAGQPLPCWRPNAALSVRGHREKKSSGVRLEYEEERFVAYLQAQAHTSADGSWLRLPIARNTRRDEHQGEMLRRMTQWDVPIRKATVQIKTSGVILRLSYALDIPVPPMGSRHATLGPVTSEGRCILRTELQTKDYSSKLAEVLKKKDEWDLIRRRATAQIGWRRGHARAKRSLLSRMSWDDWLKTYLHSWARDLVNWCAGQGIGTLHVESISTGEWPADRLLALIRYKAADEGICVLEGADVNEAGGARAAEATVRKISRRIQRRKSAERELTFQLAEKG
jgi:hypothetical protein